MGIGRGDKGINGHAFSRTLVQISVLFVWCAPGHARVVDKDVDLALLGLDGLDEAVAPSLGLQNVRQTAPVETTPTR